MTLDFEMTDPLTQEDGGIGSEGELSLSKFRERHKPPCQNSIIRLTGQRSRQSGQCPEVRCQRSSQS